jgi:hypothetical protein
MPDYYAELDARVRASAPGAFARATLTCEWFEGSIRGPATAYFDAAGQPLPVRGSMSAARELSNAFHAQADAERKRHVAADGHLPNTFTLTVLPGGTFELSWVYDAGLQAREDARQRAILGDREFERLQRPAPPPPAASPQRPSNPTSVPELLGFIQQELAKDLPAGWKTLRVEGEVWQEDGINNIKTVYYYTLPDEAQRRQFSASNVYGPMNAVQRLQQTMAGEGNVWRKVQIEFTAGTSRTFIDTQ